MAHVERTTRGFGSPGKYIQGPGEMDRLEEYTSIYGPNVVALIDGFLYDSISERVNKNYSSTASKILTLKFNGEVTVKEIERVKNAAAPGNPDVFVGIGGGKTLDTAKAVAGELGIPVIIAPTSASTDAPTSALSVVYTEEGVQSHLIFYKKNPDIVLMDSEIIAKAPVRLLVSGMGDALSTYFEARSNAESDSPNYIGKGYRRCKAALAIAKICYDVLLEDGLEAKLAAERGICSEALENIIEANTLLSGLGFENSGVAAGHGINEGFTALPEAHGYYHGEKVAVGTICMLVLENRPKEEIETVIKFCLSVGLPVTLRDLGIEPTPEKVKIIAQKAAEPGATIHSEPFKITEELVYNAVMAADALANYYKQKWQ